MNSIGINVKDGSGSVIGKLDLGDAEINLIYQITDIREPSKKQSNFSYPFTIPGTKNNNKIFQHIFENGFSSFKFNPSKKIDAQMILNDNEFFIGDLQLNKVNKEDNKVVSYDITIYGKIPSFFDEISDYNINDIIDLSDYNHAYTKTNIVKSWDTQIYQYGTPRGFVLGDGYVYPMEWRGQNNETYWKAEDFKPSIYLKTLFDRILKGKGFSYTSDFLNSSYFRRLIIPYNGDDQIPLTEQQIQSLEVWAKYPQSPFNPFITGAGSKTGQTYNNNKLIFTDDTNAPATDIGNNYNPVTGIVTIPKNGKWTLSSTIKVFNTFTGKSLESDEVGQTYPELKIFAGPLEGVLKIKDVDTGYTLQTTAFTFTCPQIDGNKHNTPILSDVIPVNVSYTGYLSAGRRLAVYLDWRTTGSNYTYKTKGQGFGGAWYQKNTEILINIQTDSNPYEAPRLILTLIDKNVAEGDQLDMNYFIPDMKAVDLVNDVTKLFNLYWVSTGDKSFNIEPRNQFYKPTDIKDWTYKLDNNETVEITPLYDLSAKTWTFQYSEDSDYYNDDYQTTYEEPWGSKKLEVDNDFVTDEVNIKSSFSGTPGVQYLSTDRVLPSYVKSGSNGMESYSPKLRILFYGGAITTANGWYFRNPYTGQISGRTTITNPATGQTSQLPYVTYPYAGHFDNPTNPTYDLNWAVSKKFYYTWNNITTNNLFNMFWRDYIDEIVDKNNHLLVATVVLNDFDIINLDLRCLIQVDNVYYRINKITYNPLTGYAQVELFRAKDYIKRAGSSISSGSVGGDGVGGGPFPRPWTTDWNYLEQQVQRTFTTDGFVLDANWTKPYIRTELSSAVFTPITGLKEITTELGTEPIYKNSLFNKSGQSWGDVVPVAQFYPTQNKDVNGNFYSPQAAQKVIGENNYVDPSAFAVEVKGYNNNISSRSSNITITGDNNTISSGVRNVTVIGDNQVITESDTSYINGVVIRKGIMSKKTTIVKSPSNSSGVDVCAVSGGKNSVMASKIWKG